MKPRPRSRLAGAAIVGAMLLAACAGRERPTEAVDVTPGFRIQRKGAPLGSAVEITYTWAVGPSFQSLAGEHGAFVHFIDSQGGILFGDDHIPVPAPASWKAGETYTYTRTNFIPILPYLGPVQVRMGLYPSAGQGERLALKGEDAGRQEYVVGSTELLPQTENVFLVYKEGWHSPESLPQNPNVERTWTKQRAVVSFKSPRKDVILYLEADTNRKAFSKPPVLTVRAGKTGLRIPIEDSEIFLKKIRFRSDSFDASDWIDLELAMNESFVPKELGLNNDDRELALCVYNLYLGEEDLLGGELEDVVDAAPLGAPE